MTATEVRILLAVSTLWLALGTILVIRARAMRAEASALLATALEHEKSAYARSVRNSAEIDELQAHIHALSRMEFGIAIKRSAIIAAKAVQS